MKKRKAIRTRKLDGVPRPPWVVRRAESGPSAKAPSPAKPAPPGAADEGRFVGELPSRRFYESALPSQSA